jgi:hypothetical protein
MFGIPVSWLFTGLLMLSPLVTYGAMKVREEIVVTAAVNAEKVKAVAQCEAQIVNLNSEAEERTRQGIAEALRASEAVKPIAVQAQVVTLCKADTHCRDKKKGAPK